MPQEKNDRLWLLFVVAGMLLNFPLLGLAARQQLVAGLPQLYVYIFVVWLGIIVATAILLNSPSKTQLPPPATPPETDPD